MTWGQVGWHSVQPCLRSPISLPSACSSSLCNTIMSPAHGRNPSVLTIGPVPNFDPSSPCQLLQGPDAALKLPIGVSPFWAQLWAARTFAGHLPHNGPRGPEAWRQAVLQGSVNKLVTCPVS